MPTHDSDPLKAVEDFFGKDGLRAMSLDEMLTRYYRNFATTYDLRCANMLWGAWVDEHPDEDEMLDTRRNTGLTPEQQVEVDKLWPTPTVYQTVFDPLPTA